jgi:tetratricopeptide (TPR) repeat protein
VVVLRNIADICRHSGQHGEAFAHYHTALRLAREIGDPYEEAKVLEGTAETWLITQQRPIGARILFRQALDIYEQLGLPEAKSARVRMETINPAVGQRIF